MKMMDKIMVFLGILIEFLKTRFFPKNSLNYIFYCINLF